MIWTQAPAQRRRILQTACAVGMLALAAGSSSQGLPPPGADGMPLHANLVYRTTARFQFLGLPMNLSGRTTTSWRLQGDHYETHLHIDTVDFDQLSQGALGPDGMLVPTRYTEKRPFHQPEAVAIDWAAGQIQFGAGPKAAAPAAGAQDRLSLQFELGRLRRLHPEQYAPGTRHDLHLIGTHDVDPWTFTVGAEEAVDTGAGAQRAVRYSARRMAGTVEETIDIWLGADLQWLPVRIRMVDRHKSVIDSVLQSSELS